MNRAREALKIVLLCVFGSIAYGIAHDQITARIYLPYFTKWHPHIIDSQDPTVVALVWGVVATWWMGLTISIALCLAALGGDQPPARFRTVAKNVMLLLAAMVSIAAVTGGTSYLLHLTVPDFMVQKNGPFPGEEELRRFTAVWLTHSASYASGSLGGIALCLITFLQREKPSNP